MNNNFELDLKIKEMASRIRELRLIENLSTATMAEKTGITEEQYIQCEEGLADLNFAFIYRFSSTVLKRERSGRRCLK